MTPEVTLSALFVSAFVSSTLLPGGSEIALAAIVAQDRSMLWPAVAVAATGNTLGGLTSYAVGRLLPRPTARPRALALAQHYGVAALLLSWLPLIGDALCVASGWLRHDLVLATLAIATGKLARYILLAVTVQGLAS
jgi:membrane protein YqaA with SNARE-associated domain